MFNPKRLAIKFYSLLNWQLTADILTMLGFLAYVFQSWNNIHRLPTIVDEGSYMIKGYLFATGRYTPYAEYGIWTNHMPLAFLIPGYVQAWFDPGLRVGRYFSLVLGALFLLGVYFLVKRLSGKWWALAAVWVIVLNGAFIEAFSIGVSQVLAACILVWVLVFGLGDDRNDRHRYFSSFLAGVLFMTRINMAPVLPALMLYWTWRSGWRTSLKVSIPGLLVVSILTALYLPEILIFYRAFLPRIPAVAKMLNISIQPLIGKDAWDPQVTMGDRINSLLLMVRLNFVSLWAVLVSVALWPRSQDWKSKSAFRIATFLLLLFILLSIEHTVFTLRNNACVFCLGGYMKFFSVIGIVLLIFLLPMLRQDLPKWSRILIIGFMLIIFISIAYTSLLGNRVDLFPPRDIHKLLNMRVPRLGSMQILDGKVKLWILLQNKYGLNFEKSFIAFQILISSLVFGGVAWFLSLVVAWITRKIAVARLKWLDYSTAKLMLTSIMLLSIPLSATRLLNNPEVPHCSPGVIIAHEEAGDILQDVIPFGAKVFWDAGISAVPLLYLPHADIYPAQINGSYSLVIGGDTDTALKRGRWNEEVRDSWMQEADFLLVSDFKIGNYPAYVDSGSWIPVGRTDPVNPCDSDSAIQIFQRID